MLDFLYWLRKLKKKQVHAGHFTYAGAQLLNNLAGLSSRVFITIQRWKDRTVRRRKKKHQRSRYGIHLIQYGAQVLAPTPSLMPSVGKANNTERLAPIPHDLSTATVLALHCTSRDQMIPEFGLEMIPSLDSSLDFPQSPWQDGALGNPQQRENG